MSNKPMLVISHAHWLLNHYGIETILLSKDGFEGMYGCSLVAQHSSKARSQPKQALTGYCMT